MKKPFILFFCLGIVQTLVYAPTAVVTTRPEIEQFNQRCNLLAAIIQELAQKISTGTLKTSNPHAYTVWLKELSTLLTQLRTTTHATTEEDFCSLFAQHTIITNSVYCAFQDSFRALPERLAHSVLIKATHNVCTAEPELASIMYKNELLLRVIPHIMQTHGLTSLNYAYNKASRLIQEHPTFLRAATALGALFLTYRLKQRYYPSLKIANLIIQASSALTPVELLMTARNCIPGKKVKAAIKYSIAAGCVIPRVVDARTIRIKIMNLLGTTHQSLSGDTIHKYTAGTSDDEAAEDENIPLTQDSHTETVHEMVDYLLHMPRYQKAGIFRSKSVLFTGKPGNGKTVKARQIEHIINTYRKETGIPCAFIEIKEEDQHDLAQAIIDAQREAPCIIFIDEIHLAGYGLQTNGDKRLLNKMLTLLQALNTNNKQVLLIGATNRPELLDEALMRDGRFTVETFRDPTFEERKKILSDLCNQSALDATTLNLDLIAHLTSGCSRSSINHLFKTAAFKAKQKSENLGQAHLYAALNMVVRKLQPAYNLSAEERAIVAAHHAGTAIMHLLLEPADTILESITMLAAPKKIREIPSYKAQQASAAKNYELLYGATYTYSKNELFKTASVSEQIKQCKLTIAGVEAQKVLTGSASSYCNDGYAQAYQLVIATLTHNIPLDKLAEKDQEQIKEQAKKLLMQYQKEVCSLLTKHKKKLAALSEALQAKTFLTRPEINTVIATTKIV